jgi:hypothetical protein
MGIVNTPLVSSKHVVTFAAATLTTQLYLDGVANGSGSHSVAATGTATSISIGSESNDVYLYGHIKNFRIDNRTLTSEQIALL